MDKSAFVLRVKIQPNCSKNEIIERDGQIKVKLTAAPIEGKANKALIEFLSETFKVPKTSITIVKGETSREKTVAFKIMPPKFLTSQLR